MVSSDNVENSSGVEKHKVDKAKDRIPLCVSTSQRALVTGESSENGISDGSSYLSRMLRFLKFGNLAEERDEVSCTRPSSSSLHIHERFSKIFSRKLDWVSLWKICKEWIRDPVNLALFIWIICVAVSGAILFMVMTGMLNRVLPKKSQRDAWFEVNNQILNALFTLICLYQHPKRIYHLALLLRWRPEDVSKLRKIYCKNGTYKPNEWVHMMVVVILLHMNCFSQYALCSLNLGYKRSERSPIGVGICISFAIATPAIAGIYNMLSPLGKDYETEMDEEAQVQVSSDASSQPGHSRRMSLEKRFSFASRDDDDERTVDTNPRWSGGILDLWDDIALAYLSLFCSFCVFGWNMERLGFGNMYVHITTFLLFCMAPFWIFNLAAINIDNEAARVALGLTGIFLCVFGLLYGGFWRSQMRKRFNLPSYNFCCGKPAMTDCALWLFCCWCSLAQEVRTGNSYEIVEDKFYRKRGDQLPMSPLPREDGEIRFSSSPGSSRGNSSSSSHFVKAYSPSRALISEECHSQGKQLSLSLIGEDSVTRGKDETLIPPIASVIQR